MHCRHTAQAMMTISEQTGEKKMMSARNNQKDFNRWNFTTAHLFTDKPKSELHFKLISCQLDLATQDGLTNAF